MSHRLVLGEKILIFLLLAWFPRFVILIFFVNQCFRKDTTVVHRLLEDKGGSYSFCPVRFFKMISEGCL